MIRRLFELDSLLVREVMVSRPDMVMIPVNIAFDDLLRLVRDTNYSRLPVYEDSRDKIIGTLSVKELFRVWVAQRASGTQMFPLRALLAFIGVEWSDEVLAGRNRAPGHPEAREWAAVDTAALGTWREELQPAEKQIVCAAIGQLLIELGYERDLAWGGAAAARPARGEASPHFAKRWTRAERLWIELIALWRTVRDPRHPWWPRLTGAALAALYLASPVATHMHRNPVVGVVADILVLAIAGTLAAMLTPSLLRAKRRAIKRARAAREGLSYPILRPPPRPA